MREAQVNPSAIACFARHWDQLASGTTGVIEEDSIWPVTNPIRFEELPTDSDRRAIASTVMIKLNGGLGTSMGLNQAKALLQVRSGLSFLDISVRQVLAARRQYDVRLPLVFMDSFNTRADCLAALAAYPELQVGDLPIDMTQSQEPKLLQSDLRPVVWPFNPGLEWCPPGHGDLYPTLWDSGVLDDLIRAGFRYGYVSNCDNLGAAPSAVLANWFAHSGAGFAIEIAKRTAMDRKGGHVAIRKVDRRLILRELAQTHHDEITAFTDHPYFNCNNLWLDLDALRTKLAETGGVLNLPLIRNLKTVDPIDSNSPGVIQIESAMGAAIEFFDDAVAIAVPRSRFLPVKNTSELALLRSDVFEFGTDYIPKAQVNPLPVVDLGQAYSSITAFEERIPYQLCLREAQSFTVRGDWRFGHNVKIAGDVCLDPPGGTIPDNTVLRSGTVGEEIKPLRRT